VSADPQPHFLNARKQERKIAMAQRKPTYLQKRNKDEVNKKAIIWTGSILLAIVVLMTVLLILNK
jgi:hypothetical protein